MIAKVAANQLSMSDMPMVSEQLRQAREAQKLTVEQVADFTKIRSDHIRALESANYDVFSAPVYIRGFTRSYASILKLDVPRVMADLDKELGATSRFSEPPSLTGGRRGLVDFLMLQLSKIDPKKGLITLGVLIIAGIIFLSWWAWQQNRKRDPLKGLKPGVYQSTQHISDQTLPLPAPAPRH